MLIHSFIDLSSLPSVVWLATPNFSFFFCERLPYFPGSEREFTNCPSTRLLSVFVLWGTPKCSRFIVYYYPLLLLFVWCFLGWFNQALQRCGWTSEAVFTLIQSRALAAGDIKRCARVSRRTHNCCGVLTDTKYDANKYRLIDRLTVLFWAISFCFKMDSYLINEDIKGNLNHIIYFYLLACRFIVALLFVIVKPLLTLWWRYRNSCCWSCLCI